MYNSLELFQTAAAMARHAGSRQAVVARNIANADTPGYQAQQIAPFKDTYETTGGGVQKVTRAGHMTAASAAPMTAVATPSGGEASPNGNTVSIEEEMLNSVSISREHSRALTIYRHTMNVLRTSLGRS